nr:reverse transcriptase domain, reverse transcriptase zinc-binding domain protein [Tanacetum cinerariifolium]
MCNKGMGRIGYTKNMIGCHPNLSSARATVNNSLKLHDTVADVVSHGVSRKISSNGKCMMDILRSSLFEKHGKPYANEWDIGTDVDLNMLRCPLCKLQPDSHEHLFFECGYSSKVWFEVLDMAAFPSIPLEWDVIMGWVGVRVLVEPDRCCIQRAQADGQGQREDDPDIIHFDNSSDLPLSTSLNDLDNATLHVDGQSTEVDVPPDIIDVVDEDDDISDDENAWEQIR